MEYGERDTDRDFKGRHQGEETNNEILGHASRSPEATEAQFHLTEILSNAELVKQLPLKAGNKNQKAFSKMYHLQWRQSRVLIGYQQSKGEHALYYISGGQKK